ncbi:MAG: fibronectin type III domain-containing protein [Nitrosomonadales bacterium]|nr:fibronectin type III domain-containing protein [Nitrosomonadales bacterium]
MKRFFARLIVIFGFMFLAGCHGSGSSAPAPTNVHVIAGDTSVTVSWDMLPGVEYWTFQAAGTSISPEGCITMPECKIKANAVSPVVLTGLTNGTTYSFTVNGRISGGKGGSGSPSVFATPRLAGATWSVGTSLGTNALNGVAYGSVFVAAGTNGTLFSSVDGISWTPLNNPVPAYNLNAITYSGGKYLAVGASGVILSSTDTVTWTQQASGVTNKDLYAVTGNGASGFVATGAAGTILTSGDGLTWTAAVSNTSNPLYGITYGNGRYVAVGAATAGVAGTLLTSTDGMVWAAIPAMPAVDMKGVAYGVPQLAFGYTAQTLPAATFVALGANGTLLTSPDGINWAARTSISATMINAVTFGRQFVAVDNVGGIFVSADGVNWSPASPSSTSPLYAVTHGLYDYVAVGASGMSMHAM